MNERERFEVLDRCWVRAHIKYGESVDFSPYTPMFDEMYMRYVAETGELISRNMFWRFLLGKRKAKTGAKPGKLTTEEQIRKHHDVESRKDTPRRGDDDGNGPSLFAKESWSL